MFGFFKAANSFKIINFGNNYCRYRGVLLSAKTRHLSYTEVWPRNTRSEQTYEFVVSQGMFIPYQIPLVSNRCQSECFGLDKWPFRTCTVKVHTHCPTTTSDILTNWSLLEKNVKYEECVQWSIRSNYTCAQAVLFPLSATYIQAAFGFTVRLADRSRAITT